MAVRVRQDDSNVRIWTNPSSSVAVPSGKLVKDLDGMAGVVQGLTNVPPSGQRAIDVRCEVEIDSASATTFPAGGVVTFDPATDLAISGAPSGAQFYCGTALRAKVNGETVVRVLLNGQGPSVPPA